MNIGIIGAGRIGANAARLFAEAGHRVAISNSREPESLESLVAELGPNASAMTVEDAAAFGEIVLLAIPWRIREEGLPPANLLDGKIVIDAMNPYTPSFEVEDLGDDTSSEDVARRLPSTRLVKAFNTMYSETLRSEARPSAPLEERIMLFVAGDDTEAGRGYRSTLKTSSRRGRTRHDPREARIGERGDRPVGEDYGRDVFRAQRKGVMLTG